MNKKIKILLLIILSSLSFGKAQYIPWNATSEREYETINNWVWMAQEGYKNHFYHYCLDCLTSLDDCNRSERILLIQKKLIN